MFFKNLNKDRNNKLAYIVFFCFCVAILLIVLSFYLVNKAANSSKNILDYVAENSLENLKGYNGSLTYQRDPSGYKIPDTKEERLQTILQVNSSLLYPVESKRVTKEYSE